MAGHPVNLQELDGPRLIRREELAASRRLDMLCFPGFVGDIEEKDLIASYTPPRRGGIHVICHQGVPISKVGVYHSQVNLYGSYTRVASIGGVCTHPGYRGLGLATRLLDYCVRKLIAEGARLMLVSGVRGLYTRAGCAAAGDFEHIALEPGQPHLEINKLSLRPATKADVPLCARLYQMEAVHFVRRLEEFTKFFRQREKFPQTEGLIVEISGYPVAYLFLGAPWWKYQREENPNVRAVSEYSGSRVALVSALPEVMTRLNLQKLLLLVPWQDMDFLQLLREQGITGDRIALLDHAMRIVNFPGLMSDLRPYVEVRLTRSLRRGLQFEQKGDRYAIVRGRERLELDGTTMTRLVMGLPEEMSSDVGVDSGALSEIISALFPLPSFLPGMNYR